MKTRSTAPRAGVAAWALLCASAPAHAHIAQEPYNLPVPFAMYAYGATGALFASFVVIGVFARGSAGDASPGQGPGAGRGFQTFDSPALRTVLGVLSVAFLVLSILTGFFGPATLDASFNTTFFWIVCLLGFTYLTALIGDWYPLINPWRTLFGWLATVPRVAARRLRPYPPWLGHGPALGFYIALIWLELFGHTTPLRLSLVLIGYTVITAAGAWLYGEAAWFRHGDVFELFFGLVAKVAPLDVRIAASSVRVRWRMPFVGCLEAAPAHFSLLLFVLFMLSSTAFDGLHETVAWVGLFWRGLYPLLASFIATHDPRQYLVLVKYFYYWQWLMLVASPFVYLALYWAFIRLTIVMTGTRLSARTLALAFAYSLIPIALVYNVSHYFTLFVGQAPAIVSMVSDPFGRGWNLFGTRELNWKDTMFEAGVVWHTQVWLILAGHIVSVYLSHVEALKRFENRRQAMVSQVPMLLLMMALTTIGLWILSLPIASGQVMMPPVKGP